MKYYTYILSNSLDGLPFYVGKGSGSRMYKHLNEAKNPSTNKRSVHSKILSILKKGGSVLYQRTFHSTEELAFDEEKRLISLLGRKDLGTGTLCNLTDGGEGSTNQSVDSIQKRANSNRGSKRSEQSKKYMSLVQKTLAENNRLKYGKACSPETSELMSKSRKGKKWSKAARDVQRNKPTAQAVLVYHKNTLEFVGEWESISLCAKELECDHSAIWKICNGNWITKTPNGTLAPFKTHKGYIFKYKHQKKNN